EMGRELARKFPVDADIVVPVPDSGNYAALGFAQELKIPYAHAFVRNHYIGRTFLQPSQLIRDFDVRVKLNLIKEMVAGKRVVVVDDSIVRGTTARARVVNLREAGAKGVHMRVSCPPHRFACHYGIDFPDPQKLIANQMSMEEIRKYHGPPVLARIFLYGGLCCTNFPGMLDLVLVLSIDGVSSKVKIVMATNKHATVSADLVNHCVKVIDDLGMRPSVCQDYIRCENL